MANDLTGLFGPTPDEIAQLRQQQLQANALQYAKLDPFERANMGIYQGVGMLAGAGAKALGGVSPQEQMAQQVQQATQGLDTSTAEGLLEGARRLMNVNPSLAQRWVQEARKVKELQTAEELKRSQIKKNEAYQPGGKDDKLIQYLDRMRELSADGQQDSDEYKYLAGMVRAMQAAKTGKQPSRVTYKTEANQIVQQDPTTGKFYKAGTDQEIDASTLGKLYKIGTEKVAAESTTVKEYVDENGVVRYGIGPELKGKVSAGKSPEVAGLIKGAQKGAETGNELALSDYKSAKASAEVIPKIDRLITQLETGDVSTGTMADIRLGMNKVIAALGGMDAAKKASDTEIADVMMSSEVFPLIQSLGIGAKGMDTPAEREFLRKAMTGALSMEKDTLLTMARQRKLDMLKSVNDWDSSVARGERKTFFKNNGLPETMFLRKPEAPKSPSNTPVTYGEKPFNFTTPASVKAAVGKTITREQARQILLDMQSRGIEIK
jgi:hypothetical protein